MRTVSASVLRRSGASLSDPLLQSFHDAWRHGNGPSLESYQARCGDGPEAMNRLALLVKADLQRRFAEGEQPAIAEYLERFPELSEEHDRMVSLVYEEYCLREECGAPIDLDSFYDRYAPWRDSIHSQLNYHERFSQFSMAPSGSPLGSRSRATGSWAFSSFRSWGAVARPACTWPMNGKWAIARSP